VRSWQGELAGRLTDWWRRQRLGRPKVTRVQQYRSHADVPERIPRRVLAVVGTPAAWAMFECPCGQGHRIMVRIRPHATGAHWELTRDGRPSLRPSIDSQHPGRRCHFWLRKGRVHWI
jgi:hypothetical protein